MLAGSSPLTRGAPAKSASASITRGLIPAYAGSTDAGAVRRLLLRGSSPLTRGALVHDAPATLRRGLIPAYAGSTKPSIYHPKVTSAHPRLRGEHG